MRGAMEGLSISEAYPYSTHTRHI